MPRTSSSTPSGPRPLGELGGALGDLGTLLPYAIGAIGVAGMAPLGVLAGFGIALIASGLFYGLPMAVQPMKIVGTLVVTGELEPQAIVAAGLLIGALMLILGLTGMAGRLSRLIPPSVVLGLQLGLGAAMAWTGLRLMAGAWWIGAGMLILLLALLRQNRWPAAPVALACAVAAGLAAGLTAWPAAGQAASPLVFSWPDWGDFAHAALSGVLPQLPLTLANAVVTTAALAAALHPQQAARATPRNLCLTTGVFNLLMAPFGALPMCHGAGGLQAQHRFGARTGAAPVLLGVLLLLLAFGAASSAAGLLGLIPMPAVGALLLIAGADLALSKRLFEARPDCRPAIGVTALVALALNPAAALAAGCLLEWLRRRRAGLPA